MYNPFIVKMTFLWEIDLEIMINSDNNIKKVSIFVIKINININKVVFNKLI